MSDIEPRDMSHVSTNPAGLQTLESRFLALTLAKIEKDEPGQEISILLGENPHLWPFFCFPGNQEFMAPLGKISEPQVPVRVYRGRWLTDCPFCYSAQDASFTDHWFFCAGCKNAGADNRSVPTVWPDDHEQIAEVLLVRPFMDTRNWFPHENVDDLLRENEEHL